MREDGVSRKSAQSCIVLDRGCWDNACSETLFGSLKVERLHGQRFETIHQAKNETITWLLWYNQTRMHSTLHYASPMQFEKYWMDATVKIAA